jgi:UDP-N-acetylglucosamine 2-epimerase (non-hydrolysing)
LGGIGGVETLEQAGVVLMDSLSYLDFLSLEIGAGAILTDSGGVQEEASALGIPCFTLRDSTERPITVELGTNTVLGADPSSIARVAVAGGDRRPCDIPFWDGHAGERAADVLVQLAMA